MSWRDEYEKAKAALNTLYDEAETEAERDKIEAKQSELIQANMRYVVEQMQTRAIEMRALIGSLQTLVKPNNADKITGAAKNLEDVLDIWRKQTVVPGD